MKNRSLAMFALVLGLNFAASPCYADPDTEERFQDIFITAGYATAFGAALGAASLAFQNNPENQLRHIQIGASLGFIGGSIMGAYFVFSPVVVSNDSEQPTSMLAGNVRHTTPRLQISPLVDRDTLDVSGVATGFSLATF